MVHNLPPKGLQSHNQLESPRKSPNWYPKRLRFKHYRIEGAQGIIKKKEEVRGFQRRGRTVCRVRGNKELRPRTTPDSFHQLHRLLVEDQRNVKSASTRESESRYQSTWNLFDMRTCWLVQIQLLISHPSWVTVSFRINQSVRKYCIRRTTALRLFWNFQR